ncbi:hypothetical protein PWG71_16485 [Nocardiopsis sp. N85]|uniref:hypothetical protein n=1 Tax=Nocardiopsis sp. N85 TaxID=3029400 RepID=UPI00237F5CA9|nr:hypothetical protein [Nocardiopsis sp. N85]MDE3722988.1 hypothetical protein [Nocardiopsis sp. N85]
MDRDTNAPVVHSRPERGEHQDRSRHLHRDKSGIPGTGMTPDTDGLKKRSVR